jgi:hypothetical protein
MKNSIENDSAPTKIIRNLQKKYDSKYMLLHLSKLKSYALIVDLR